jgi:hypothetical protein
MLTPLLALALAAAPAGDLSGAIGNVVVMRGHPAMGDVRLKLEAGGAYEADLGDGSVLKGTWTSDGAKLCFFARTLPRGCDVSIFGKHVGDKWSVAIPKSDKAIEMSLEPPRA